LREGSAANDAMETMIKILSSIKEETQAKSASALAGIFETRKDLRESSVAVKTLWSNCMFFIIFFSLNLLLLW
jgi:hypothetical protein